MLNQAKLPITSWGSAVLYLTHILNVTPSSALSNTTSYEVWNKQKPDISRFRTYGCQAWVHIPKTERRNLDPHSQSCIFLGFEEGYKALS